LGTLDAPLLEPQGGVCLAVSIARLSDSFLHLRRYVIRSRTERRAVHHQ